MDVFGPGAIEVGVDNDCTGTPTKDVLTKYCLSVNPKFKIVLTKFVIRR